MGAAGPPQDASAFYEDGKSPNHTPTPLQRGTGDLAPRLTRQQRTGIHAGVAYASRGRDGGDGSGEASAIESAGAHLLETGLTHQAVAPGFTHAELSHHLSP